jgi:hypothetical protein
MTYGFLHEVGDIAEELEIIICEEGDCLAFPPGAPCSPHSMYVRNNALREIIVDDDIHCLEVDSSAH